MRNQKTSSGNAFLQYVGYVFDLVASPPVDQRVDVETLPGLVAERFGVQLPPSCAKEALARLDRVICRTPRGYVLSPLAAQNSRATFFENRAGGSQRAKRAVAAFIYREMLSPLEALFLDAGSANFAIAEELAWGAKKNFTVLTNNVRAVRMFLANPTIRVFVTGGVYDVEDEALVGRGAEFDPHWFNCTTAFVGASAISTHHVFNHAITGEEELKRFYWQIPANELVVPSALGKFRLKDVSCFGSLYQQVGKTSDASDRANIHTIGRQERAKRIEAWKTELQTGEFNSQAPGFKAGRCRIVVEPRWMIDDEYADCQELKENLLGSIATINAHRAVTKVEVIHAELSRSDFEKQFF